MSAHPAPVAGGRPAKLAVTGATGFLGSNLCALAAREGHEVVAALGTDPARGARLAADGFRFVAARLSEVDAMARAVQGSDAVVHCAALSTAWGARSAFEEANVAGTANVVAACRLAGVARIVHVSSASVYFALRDQPGLREDVPLPEPFNDYARSKVMAEAEALAFEGDVAVLRPRGIFGPGDTALVPRLARAARGGRLPLLRGGRALVSVTFVDVVSSAILAAAHAPGPLRGVFNVAHQEAIAVKDLVERIMTALGQPFAWRRVPLGPALATARAIELAAAWGGGREPAVTTYTLGLLAYTQTLDIAATRARLCWIPPVSLDEGLRRTTQALEAARCR